MRIDTKYNLGDIVFLKTDIDQLPRMITGILVYQNGMSYELSVGNSSSNHYDIEFCMEQNKLLSLGIN